MRIVCGAMVEMGLAQPYNGTYVCAQVGLDR